MSENTDNLRNISRALDGASYVGNRSLWAKEISMAADTIDRLENELRAVKAAYEAEPGPLDEARVEFERYANFCCGHEE